MPITCDVVVTFSQGDEGPPGPRGPPGERVNTMFVELCIHAVYNCVCSQGEAGPPGQAGVDGLMGDRGVPVGVKSTVKLSSGYSFVFGLL